MPQNIQLIATVAEDQLGQRLDQTLAELFPDYSRSRLKNWILQDRVKVNGSIVNKAREKMSGGEKIEIDGVIEEEVLDMPEPINLNIVHEDDDILIIDKPVGLVVHPGAGTPAGTLLNALLYYYPDIANVPRAGIVHRLDKDTSGLMVVAKTIPAQTYLVDAIQQRRITREYEAIVMGTMTAGGTVDEPIGRHPTQRTQMAVHPTGKPAVTHYRLLEHFRAHTHLRLRLESGRTHQIRVHMAYIHHPLVGDPVYGGRPRPPKKASPELLHALSQFKRQALHAVMLRLNHPITGELMEWHSAIPADMHHLIELLREDTLQFQHDMD